MTCQYVDTCLERSEKCYEEIMTKVKVLIPNKSWLIENGGEKIGTLSKEKSGYSILQNGQKYEIGNANNVREQLGIDITEELVKTKKVIIPKELTNSVYDFPCSSKPFNPLYNVRKKLPIYAKSTKSKSQYCAGYYVIQFRKGWVKSFCPKLITLERYPFNGPFRTEQEMRQQLNLLK
jgi:hypothetical protein